MSIRSVCMILVMSAVFTIPAFGQAKQDCAWGDANCYFNLSTPSYDTNAERDFEKEMRDLQYRTQREALENLRNKKSQECGIFYAYNEKERNECYRRNQ